MLDVKQNGARGREAQRAVGERSGAPTSGADRVVAPAAAPKVELTERPRRRRFTAEYKLRILEQADACRAPGDVGALLRREGLYTSHLAAWRQQREHGALAALGRRRGRRKTHPLEIEITHLRQRAERAEAELATAQKVIAIQGNVSALLEAMLESRSAPTAPAPDPPVPLVKPLPRRRTVR
jgi:transposase